MAYKHILIAVDLSQKVRYWWKRRSPWPDRLCKVSLIHVDVNFSDLYTGLIDVNLGDMQKRILKKPQCI